MRIIAGRLGGRVFASPHGHATHPMSDRVRGALFNSLGDIEGLSVLDAFAGSGALSFEAVSRGARSALALDSDKSAQRTIQENTRTLGLGSQVRLIRSSAGSWLNTEEEDSRFDLILLDPPYQDLQLSLLARLVSRLKPDGTLVLSWPGGTESPAFDGLQLVLHKSYGDAELLFYQTSVV